MLYAAIIGSYLLGSVSFAIIISRVLKLADPRKYGSHNAGATNVMRSGNKKAAVLTLVGDMVKGLLVVLIARLLFAKIEGGSALVALCGILAIIGHIYPIFFKFKGGKGVATSIGVLLGFNVYLALLVIITWLIVFKLFKISSLAALVAATVSPVYAYALMGNNAYFGATTFIAILILWKHKSNIVRLLNKQEQGFKPKDE